MDWKKWIRKKWIRKKWIRKKMDQKKNGLEKMDYKFIAKNYHCRQFVQK